MYEKLFNESSGTMVILNFLSGVNYEYLGIGLEMAGARKAEVAQALT